MYAYGTGAFVIDLLLRPTSRIALSGHPGVDHPTGAVVWRILYRYVPTVCKYRSAYMYNISFWVPAGKVKGTTATSCTPYPNVVIGTGGNPYIWWATVSLRAHTLPFPNVDARATPMMLPSKQTSGIVILITLATTCLFCCSFVGLCCGGLPNAVIYVSAVGVVIALLGYTLLLAWVGVGTYLAAEVQESTGENCINYYVYLAFFYAFILVLLLFSLVSLVWKLRNPVKENLLSKLPIPA